MDTPLNTTRISCVYNPNSLILGNQDETVQSSNRKVSGKDISKYISVMCIKIQKNITMLMGETCLQLFASVQRVREEQVTNSCFGARTPPELTFLEKLRIVKTVLCDRIRKIRSTITNLEDICYTFGFREIRA